MSNARSPALIKKDLRQRFYAAVVFLSAVTGAFVTNRQPVSHDLATWQSPVPFEAKFKDFVNILAQFCDVKLGGDSVTAFAVLDRQDRLEYRFACNRMNKNRLTRMQNSVTDLLQTLRNTPPGGPGDVDLVLLEKVLVHCRTRIHSYLGYFKAACRDCVRTNPGDSRLVDQLNQFTKAASKADFKNMPDEEFARCCRDLMDLIEKQRTQPDGTAVFAERATHSNMTESSNCWSELRHYAGRLVSYYSGIRTLMEAAQRSPSLTENFEVSFVRSSEPDENPMQGNAMSAETILRKMVPNPAEAARCNQLVQNTRALDLDHSIREMTQQETFRPIVHAELLVLQSLEKDGLTHPRNYFNSWRYIGSSKPTCKLCHCYFQCHNGGFQVRSTHDNLYINWKPPDVFQRDGEAAIQARAEMLNQMAFHIRGQAIRTLEEKVCVGKQHDSSTGMTFRTMGIGHQLEGGFAGPSSDYDDMETSFDDAD